MRTKQRGKVGLDMKRAVYSTQNVSLRCNTLALSAVCAAFDAVRFTFAQLFFGILGFTPTPI